MKVIRNDIKERRRKDRINKVESSIRTRVEKAGLIFIKLDGYSDLYFKVIDKRSFGFRKGLFNGRLYGNKLNLKANSFSWKEYGELFQGLERECKIKIKVEVNE